MSFFRDLVAAITPDPEERQAKLRAHLQATEKDASKRLEIQDIPHRAWGFWQNPSFTQTHQNKKTYINLTNYDVLIKAMILQNPSLYDPSKFDDPLPFGCFEPTPALPPL
eukprot:c5777_g1_i1.p1 GENE.c5777_g1_i1~~c5777_g1_i1.p1  ORF type:complete len:118 (-),score=38.21 c5777_g1_i1:27-356(-)